MICRNWFVAGVLIAFGAGLLVSIVLSGYFMRLILGLGLIFIGILAAQKR